MENTNNIDIKNNKNKLSIVLGVLWALAVILLIFWILCIKGNTDSALSKLSGQPTNLPNAGNNNGKLTLSGTSLTLSDSSGNTTSTVDLSGLLSGITGPAGPTGANGVSNTPGPAGLTGATGANGAAGAAGPAGPIGPGGGTFFVTGDAGSVETVNPLATLQILGGTNITTTSSPTDVLTISTVANPTFSSLTTTTGPNNFAGTTNTVNLTSSGAVSFTGPTFTTSVGTTSTFNGPTNLNGTTTINAPLTNNSTVTNNGPVTNNGTTTNNGPTILNNSLTTTGPNNLGGTTTINNLNVTGTSNFGGPVTFAILPDLPLPQGSIFVGNASNLAAPYAAGSNGQVLTIVGGTPTWSAAGAGGITGINGQAGPAITLNSTGPISTITGGNTVTFGLNPCAAGEVYMYNGATWVCTASSSLPTTNTKTWTQGTGLTDTVNGVAANVTPGAGAINNVLGYNGAGNPVFQSAASLLSGNTTNLFNWNRAAGQTSTVNGVAATQAINLGAVSDIVGYDAGGTPVYNSVANVLNGATTNTLSSLANTMTSTVNGVVANAPIINTNTNVWNRGTGQTTTVNGVAATQAIGIGALQEILGYDATGNPVYQNAAGLISGSAVTSVTPGAGLVGNAPLGPGPITLDVGAGNGITVAANSVAVNVATAGITGTVGSNSGLESTAGGVRLLGGCADTFILKWNAGASQWQCSPDAGAGGGITSINGQVGPAVTISSTGPLTTTTGANNVNVSLNPCAASELYMYNGVSWVCTAASALPSSNVLAWSQLGGISSTVNGVNSTQAIGSGTLSEVIGYDAGGTPTHQTSAAFLNSAITNTLTTAGNSITSVVSGVSSGPQNIINSNGLAWTRLTGLNGTVNGVAASQTINAGAAQDVLAYDAAGNPVYQSVSSLLSGNTSVSNTSAGNNLSTTVNGVVGATVPIINTHTMTWTQGGGIADTVNGVAATVATPTGVIANILGYDGSGNPVNQSVAAVLSGVTTNTFAVNQGTGFTSTVNGVASNVPIPPGVITNIVGFDGTGNVTRQSAAAILAANTTNTSSLTQLGGLTNTVNGVVANIAIPNGAVARVIGFDGAGNATNQTVASLLAASTTVSNTSAGNNLSTTVNGVVGATVPIINSNALGWTKLGGIVTTVNGVAATQTVPVGTIADFVGYNAAGAPVNQSVASVLAAATCPVTGTFACQNGNIYGTAANYGTNDAFNLNLRTNGTTKATITSAGNFGIGTATPSSQLNLAAAGASTGIALDGVATGTPALSNAGQGRFFYNSTTNNFQCSVNGGAYANCINSSVATVPISSLTAAVATNTIANSNFAQTWNWTGLGAATSALTLSGASGAANSNVLNISSSGVGNQSKALNITSQGTGDAVVIDTAQAAGYGLHISNNNGDVARFDDNGIGDVSPSILDANGNWTMGALTPISRGASGTAKLSVVSADSAGTHTVLGLQNSAGTSLAIDVFNANPNGTVIGNPGDLAMVNNGGTGQLYIKQSGVGTVNNWSQLVTAASGIPISSLLGGVAVNNIDSANFSQNWTWNTLTTGQGLNRSYNALTSGTGEVISSSSTTQTGNTMAISTATNSTGSALSIACTGLTSTGGACQNIQDNTNGNRIGLNVSVPNWSAGIGLEVQSNSGSGNGQGLVYINHSGASNNDIVKVLRVDANAQESFNVTSAGNVGIRVVTPQARLHIGQGTTGVAGNAGLAMDGVSGNPALSTALQFRMYYDFSLGQLRCSNAGSAYAGCGGVMGGVPISSLTASLAPNTILNNSTQTWNWNLGANSGLALGGTTAAQTGSTLAVSTASTGASANGFVNFTASGDHTGAGFQIDDVTTAGTAMRLNANSLTTGTGEQHNFNALTSGTGMSIASTATLMNGNLLNVTSATALGTPNGVVRYNFTGTHGSTGDIGFRVDDVTTGGTTMKINSNSITSGDALSISTNALTSGNGLLISNATPGAAMTGNLLQVTTVNSGAAANGFVRFNFAGAHTGNGFQVDDATTTGNAAQINANSQTSGNALRLTNTNAGRTGAAGTAGVGLLSINGTGSNAESISITDSTNTCTGNPGATMVFTCTSDASLKTNVEDSADILGALNQIKVRQYDWLTDGTHAKYGVVAQELEQTQLGDMVHTNAETGIKSVTQIDTWMLVKGLQEVDAKVEANNVSTLAKLADQQTQIDGLKAYTGAPDATTQDASTTQVSSLESRITALETAAKATTAPADTTTTQNTQSVATAVFNGGVVTGDVEFQGTAIFAAATTFKSTAVFKDDVTFEANVKIAGHLDTGSDTTGTATLAAGASKVHVAFSNAYAKAPSVTATPQNFLDAGSQYRVTNVTTSGFDIEVQPAQTKTVKFNWQAL